MAIGRKCTVCTHPQIKEINNAVKRGESFRSIASRYGLVDVSVCRHVNKHLGFELHALIKKAREENAVNVYEEFGDQLAFANKLRRAAELYLSNPDDPLQTLIVPHADEVEVIYLDWTDMTAGDDPKPKRKKAPLSELLRTLQTDSDYTPDKVAIKHVDLRKFALDCIETCKDVVDRFAHLGGLYKAPAENTAHIRAQNAVKTLMEMEGYTLGEALAYLAREQQARGVTLFEPHVLRDVAREGGVDVQLLEGLQ